MAMGLSLLNMCNAFCIPIGLTMLIYFKLVRYVHQMSQNITSTNNFIRIQRELKMIRRIIILLMRCDDHWFSVCSTRFYAIYLQIHQNLIFGLRIFLLIHLWHLL